MNTENSTNALHAYTSARLTCRRKLDLDLPPGVVTAMDKLQANQARAIASIQEFPKAVDRIADGMLTKDDPLSSETFRRDAAALAIAGARLQVGEAIEKAVDREARTLLRKHLPAIVDVLAAETTRLGSLIAEFRAKAPGVDLLRAERPQVAAKLLTPWALAREAVVAVSPIVTVWESIHQAALGRLPSRELALVVVDITTDQLDQLKRHPGNPAARAAAEGHPLALASMDDYLERCQRADRDRAAAERRRQERIEESRNRSLSLS